MTITVALLRDERLAVRHGVRFSVVSRPSGYSIREEIQAGRPPAIPDEHGSFDHPADAVALARSLTDRDATVVADGSGPYWQTRRPDEVSSELLVQVCRDKVLGPVEAQREHEREELRQAIERLRAEQHLPDAVGVVLGLASPERAIQALQEPPLGLSEHGARYLLSGRSLQRLTLQGQQEIAAELKRTTALLQDLGPSLDVDI